MRDLNLFIFAIAYQGESLTDSHSIDKPILKCLLVTVSVVLHCFLLMLCLNDEYLVADTM